MTPEYHRKKTMSSLDEQLGLLFGFEEDDIIEEEWEVDGVPMVMARRGKKKEPDWDRVDTESSLYNMDTVMEEVFNPQQRVEVPYPDHLINELKMSFRSNYKFIDSLNLREPKAINYLSNLANYNKSQLDAYTHLFQWLIDNNIEFGDAPPPPSDEELEEAGDDTEEVDGDDSDHEQEGDEAPNEGEQGDNEQDDQGDTQDSSNQTKSANPSKNIKESKGKGQVQKQVADAYAQNAKPRPQDGKGQPSGGAMSPGEQKQLEKAKKSLWQTLKDFLRGDKNDQTMPDKEKQSAETQADIERRETVRKLTEVLKSVKKDMEVLENDANTSKIASDQDNERHSIVNPGGRSIRRTTAQEIVKDWIDKVAISGIHLKTTGWEKWDKRKIAKYSVTNRPWMIPHAKYQHLPDRIMFQLDFSGSCSWISKTFAQLGQEACKYSHVTVAFGGYEGYVEGFITPDTNMDALRTGRHFGGGLSYGETWENAESPSLNEYLKQNPTIKTVFILGDYDGTQRYVDAYYGHRSVRFVWFLCEHYSHYRGYAHIGPLKNHIHYFDGSIEGLAKLVHRIKI